MRTKAINITKRAFRVWGYVHYAIAFGVILICNDLRTAICLIILGWVFTIVGSNKVHVVEWIYGDRGH